MPFYRVVFANNRIVSCEEEHRHINDEGLHYDHDNGEMVFAYLKAASFVDANRVANQLAAEIIGAGEKTAN